MSTITAVHVLAERQTRLLSLSPEQLVRAYMTPLSLGLYLSCFFYGMFLLAVYLYFTQFKSDIWLNRCVVMLLVCLTTADTIAGGVRVFRMTVGTPNNLAYILDVTQRPEDWLCTVMLLLTVLTSQLFMSYRIVAFARHMQDWGGKHARAKLWAMTGALGVGWAVCLGACVANMVVFYQVTNYMQLLLPTNRLARMFMVTAVAMPCVLFLMDVLIAIFMTLQYNKAKTGFGVSNHILTVLVTVVVRNGVMVAAVMLTQMLVTLLSVLWGNFMPMFYGKLHALTVVCILTEPRVAKSRWYKSQSTGPSAGASGSDGVPRQVKTPHMDYSRPSQALSPVHGPRSGESSNTAAAIKPKQYSPAFPTCAHCHAVWLPSDMDSEVVPGGHSGPSSGVASRASGSGVGAGAGAGVRHRLGPGAGAASGPESEALRAAGRTALPSSQGSGWTEGGDTPFTPFTDEMSPPMDSSVEKGGAGGDYFALAYEKGGRRESGGRLGKGTLIVEEEEEEGRERTEGLVVAVLPKAKPERAGMSFAEALLDLDGSEEEDEKDKGRKATRSKGSR